MISERDHVILVLFALGAAFSCTFVVGSPFSWWKLALALALALVLSVLALVALALALVGLVLGLLALAVGRPIWVIAIATCHGIYIATCHDKQLQLA